MTSNIEKKIFTFIIIHPYTHVWYNVKHSPFVCILENN